MPHTGQVCLGIDGDSDSGDGDVTVAGCMPTFWLGAASNNVCVPVEPVVPGERGVSDLDSDLVLDLVRDPVVLSILEIVVGEPALSKDNDLSW